MMASSEDDWRDHSQHECWYQCDRQNRQRFGMHPEEQDRKRNDRYKQISRPSLKSATASLVVITCHRLICHRLGLTRPRLCHTVFAFNRNIANIASAVWVMLCHNITSVYMLLPCSSLLALRHGSLSTSNRPARPISAYLWPTHPLFARSLTWASCSRANVGREAPASLLAVLTVLQVEICLAWLNRVLPFDSYRYAFNAETLKALPRCGRTLALMFSGPLGIGLLPQSKYGSPSNKNIRAPCEAVALGTLAGNCEPHTRRISEKEH